jgi:hypothetical protein
MRQVSGGWADGGAGVRKGSDARNLVNFLSRGWRRQVAGQHHDNQLLPAGPELHVLLALAGLYIICCLMEMRIEKPKCRYVYFLQCLHLHSGTQGTPQGPPP